MLGRNAATILALAFLAATQPAFGDEPRAVEIKRLEGSWNVTTVRFPAYDEVAVKDMSIEIRSDKITLRSCPTLAADVAAKWDPSKEPKELDISETKADGMPIVRRAIYKLDGDKLTIAVGQENGARPKDFDPAGTPKLLLKLDRAKR